jgi:ribosome-binding factor A
MSERIEKINRLLQRELGEIFQLAAKNYYQGKMITVTKVRVSPDLSFAKVYLSIFPGKFVTEIMETVEKNKKTFRHQLAGRIKNQVKIIPELAYYIDDSLDYIDKIEQILKD